MKKTISIELQRFLNQSLEKGVLEHRWSDLKQWARNKHFSPTEVSKQLQEMVEWEWLIQIRKIVDGRLAVYYALNLKYRKLFLDALNKTEEILREIDGLEKSEKIKELNELISSTMLRFAAFVPWYIHQFLQNKDKIKNLEENLETFWHWTLYPLIILTTQVCGRNQKETEEVQIIKDMQENYKEFLTDNAGKIKILFKDTS